MPTFDWLALPRLPATSPRIGTRRGTLFDGFVNHQRRKKSAAAAASFFLPVTYLGDSHISKRPSMGDGQEVLQSVSEGDGS
ncbi:hypothetical protein, partial [Mesorhizobium sp. M0701]|uniref:hypothetical protein n=1 Tax=Mesorhizobium sp. M0701 TaxID=2956989 RepID=UPI00333A9E0D